MEHDKENYMLLNKHNKEARSQEEYYNQLTQELKELEEKELELIYTLEKEENKSKQLNTLLINKEEEKNKLNNLIRNPDKINIDVTNLYHRKLNPKDCIDKFEDFCTNDIEGINDSAKEEIESFYDKTALLVHNIKVASNLINSLIIVHEKKSISFRILTDTYTFGDLFNQCALYFQFRMEESVFYNFYDSNDIKIPMCETLSNFHRGIFNNNYQVDLKYENYENKSKSKNTSNIRVKENNVSNSVEESFSRYLIGNMTSLEDKLITKFPKILVYILYIFLIIAFVAKQFNTEVFFFINESIDKKLLNSKYYINNYYQSENTFYEIESAKDLYSYMNFLFSHFNFERQFRFDPEKDKIHNIDKDSTKYYFDTANLNIDLKKANFTTFLTDFYTLGNLRIIQFNSIEDYIFPDIKNLSEINIISNDNSNKYSENIKKYYSDMNEIYKIKKFDKIRYETPLENTIKVSTEYQGLLTLEKAHHLYITPMKDELSLLVSYLEAIEFFSKNTTLFIIEMNFYNLEELVLVNAQFIFEQNKFNIFDNKFKICSISNFLYINKYFNFSFDFNFFISAFVEYVRLIYGVFNLYKAIKMFFIKDSKGEINYKFNLYVFIKNFWNLILIIKCILIITVFIYKLKFFTKLSKVNSQDENQAENHGFAETQEVCDMSITINLLDSVIIFLIMIFFLNFVNLTVMNTIIDTFVLRISKIGMYLYIAFVICIGYSLCFHYIFGPYIADFKNVTLSYTNLFYVILGNSSIFEPIYQFYAVISDLLLLMFCFTFFIILSNWINLIIIVSYTTAAQKRNENTTVDKTVNSSLLEVYNLSKNKYLRNVFYLFKRFLNQFKKVFVK